jgi:8-oxo-dGTP pyrophosphatase MutT (NUDIX family)
MKNVKKNVGIACWFDGFILLGERLKTPLFSGYYAFPGGKVDRTDDSIVEGARRELWEETDLWLDTSRFTLEDCNVEMADSKCFLFAIDLTADEACNTKNNEAGKTRAWEFYIDLSK